MATASVPHGCPENVRVRRAGLRPTEYHHFLERFKTLSGRLPREWTGGPSGAREIVKAAQTVVSTQLISGRQRDPIWETHVVRQQPEVYAQLEKVEAKLACSDPNCEGRSAIYGFEGVRAAVAGRLQKIRVDR